MKLPPVSYFIKDTLKLKSGSHKPGREFVGTITRDQIKQIAESKMPDLNCSTIESAMNIVAGQCRSMGVKVED
jgi:large subunit ribosomal protein L11